MYICQFPLRLFRNPLPFQWCHYLGLVAVVSRICLGFLRYFGALESLDNWFTPKCT